MDKQIIFGLLIFASFVLIGNHLFRKKHANYIHTYFDMEYKIKVDNIEKLRSTVLINGKYMILNHSIIPQKTSLYDILRKRDSIYIPKEIDSIYIFRNNKLKYKGYHRGM